MRNGGWAERRPIRRHSALPIPKSKVRPKRALQPHHRLVLSALRDGGGPHDSGGPCRICACRVLHGPRPTCPRCLSSTAGLWFERGPPKVDESAFGGLFRTVHEAPRPFSTAVGTRAWRFVFVGALDCGASTDARSGGGQDGNVTRAMRRSDHEERLGDVLEAPLARNRVSDVNPRAAVLVEYLCRYVNTSPSI